MSTEIVEIPALLEIKPFPALGSANYNQEAYDNGVSVPPAIERTREIVAAGRTNALAAKDHAALAETAAVTTTEKAEAVLIYRNETLSARDQAVPAAAATLLDRELAETAAQEAARDAQQVASALEAIAGGPVASVNGKPGPNPVLSATDIAPLMTLEELSQGAVMVPRSSSPSHFKAAANWNAPIGTRYTGEEKPNDDMWIEAGKVYLQASYPDLFGKLGFQPTPALKHVRSVTMPEASIWKACWMDDNTIIAVALNRTSVSYDRGATWTHRTTGYSSNPTAIACDKTTRRVIAAYGGALRATTDDGATWTSLTGVTYTGDTVSISVDALGRWLFLPEATGTYMYPVVSLNGVTYSRATTEDVSASSAAVFNGRTVALLGSTLREYDWSTSKFLTGISLGANNLVVTDGSIAARYFIPSSAQTYIDTLETINSLPERHYPVDLIGSGMAFIAWKRMVRSFGSGSGYVSGFDTASKRGWAHQAPSGLVPDARAGSVNSEGLVVTSHGYRADGYNYYSANLLVLDFCDYDRTTQFYVPRAGVVDSSKQWVKAA